MSTYFGIDCAKWQGNIDWAKVKSDGVKFAVLKVTQKNNAPEPAFERNYAGASAVDIPVGVYRYVYAQNAADAKTEAKSVVAAVKGKQITCGVWLDMEDQSLIAIGKPALKAVIDAERKVLEAAGYWVGVYCSQSWYNSVLPVDQIDLPYWIAKYGTNNGKPQKAPVLKGKHTLWGWQYTSVGRVSGISGGVDLNVIYQAPGSTKQPAKTVDSTLRKGDKGSAVQRLQQRLTLCDWRVSVDGDYGPKTETAVRGYQYKAGLTVDGIAGPKTNGKLVQDAIAAKAKDLAAYLVKHKWHYKGNGYAAKSTFAATAKLDKPGCSCAHFVSWVLQAVGLLTSDTVLSHSKAGYGIGAKSIVNADKLINCAVTYPNKALDDCADDLCPGDVLVHDSSIGIWMGDGTILTAREGQKITPNKQYADLYVTSGYEWRHDVLAVIRAKTE